jgi:hypothetical protein
VIETGGQHTGRPSSAVFSVGRGVGVTDNECFALPSATPRSIWQVVLYEVAPWRYQPLVLLHVLWLLVGRLGSKPVVSDRR